ncbi:hypothetical protein FKM82_008841 [Ascaphus truei]
MRDRVLCALAAGVVSCDGTPRESLTETRRKKQTPHSSQAKDYVLHLALTMTEDSRRGDEEDRGPGAAFHMFVLMEDLIDKLKLLNYEEEVLRKHNMKAISRTWGNSSLKQGEFFWGNPTTDAANGSEVERVLPLSQSYHRTDTQDWRIHVDQMHQHKDGIETSFKETKGYLDKLHNEISKTLEKVSSREKYIHNQLEHLVQEYRAAQAQLSEAKERYQQGSGGVTDRTRILYEITEDLEKVKQEMEEKGSSMTDGAPLVKIKQALMKLKQETVQMDIRIGVVEHTLLQSKLKEKSDMTRDMHATDIPESSIGAY